MMSFVKIIQMLVFLEIYHHYSKCEAYGFGQRFNYNGKPRNRTAIMGKYIIFNCQIIDAAGVVQWTRDDFALGGKRSMPDWPRYSMTGNESVGEYNLLITNVSPEDEAWYECQAGATSRQSTIRSGKVYLTVNVMPDDPVIQNGGDVIETFEGQLVDITCKINGGRLIPNITWYSSHDSRRRQSTWTSIEKRGNLQDIIAYYTITAKREDNGVKHYCEAVYDSSNDRKWDSAKLNVKYKPYVTMESNYKGQLNEEDNLALKCEAISNPPNISWSWYADSVKLKERSNNLLVKAVTGEYNLKRLSCIATNSIGHTRKTHTAKVLYKPYIIKPKKYKSVTLGNNVSINCNARGNPEPDITWFKGINRLLIGEEKILEINDVRRIDFDLYVCRASLKGFKSIQEQFYLFENARPFMGRTPKYQYAKLGSDAVVACIIKSLPDVHSVEWYYKKTAINFALQKRYALINKETQIGTDSFLQITDIENEDFGNYLCVVTNALGSASVIVTFQKQEDGTLLIILMGIAAGILLMLLIILAISYFCCRKEEKDENLNTKDKTNIEIIKRLEQITSKRKTNSLSEDGKKRQFKIPLQSINFGKMFLIHKSKSSTAEPMQEIEQKVNEDFFIDYTINKRNTRSNGISNIDTAVLPPLDDTFYYPKGIVLIKSASTNDISLNKNTEQTPTFYTLKPMTFINKEATNV